MSINGIGIQTHRYHIIPRTLSFVFSRGHVLLIEIPGDKGAWQGRLNGIGGHIEQGEDPLQAARREIEEETGIKEVVLQLCGVITVDTGSKPGIGLYVFHGDLEHKPELESSDEGELHWIPFDEIDLHPVLEDLSFLLSQTLATKESGIPFSAQYSYATDGSLRIQLTKP
jgi:8-oxo-dGTP diphosphatase